MSKILVTGGAGYIGSHCVLALAKKNYEVIIFDNLSTGHKETVKILQKYVNVEFVYGDLANSCLTDENNSIKSVFQNNKIDAVFHFAAFSQVKDSVCNPQKYYFNNVVGTLNLLSAMLENKVDKIVFSSTAAIYGEPSYTPMDENHPQKPINPYGQTKLIIEKIMDDYDKAYGLKSVRLRYFNVAGADFKTRIGEWHELETHLIPNILKSTFCDRQKFQMFGTDYDTKDGTCVRDYINIEDLVSAHILAYEYLKNGGESDYFNLGTNEGYSVKEVFDLCKNITGKNISVEVCERRVGDPASLVANNSKARAILGWSINHDLEYSIKTAYEWEKKKQGVLNAVG